MSNTSMMNNFPYLYRGIVLDNKDPMNLGRCRIKVPSIHGNRDVPVNFYPWSRGISVLPVNSNSGSSYVPEIGDIVWVLFEGGDKDSPVYFGGTRGTVDEPAPIDEIILYQEDDNKLSYNKNKKEFNINIGNNSITLNSEGVFIQADTIDLSSNDINLTGSVNVNGDIRFNRSVSCPIRCMNEGD